MLETEASTCSVVVKSYEPTRWPRSCRLCTELRNWPNLTNMPLRNELAVLDSPQFRTSAIPAQPRFNNIEWSIMRSMGASDANEIIFKRVDHN